jgi:hypothetical protein
MFLTLTVIVQFPGLSSPTNLARLVVQKQKFSPAYARHAEAFFDQRLPAEYQTGLKMCQFTVSTNGNGTAVHSTGRGGWARTWINFLNGAIKKGKCVWPPNVTMGITGGDYVSSDIWPCNTNSGPRKATSLNYQHDVLKLKQPLNCSTPWEARSGVPLFRGNLRLPVMRLLNDTKNMSLGDFYKRAQMAVKGHPLPRLWTFIYSHAHPKLLDAKSTGAGWSNRHLARSPWSLALNGQFEALQALWPAPENKMPVKHYYCHSKVSLVLRGIGAAFRLDCHLASGSAVVLEAASVELWYLRYLVPYTHYIPLAAGAANLSDVLHWARSHPEKVRIIGMAGRAFYDGNLAPEIVANNLCYFMRSVRSFVAYSSKYRNKSTI